VVVKPNYWNLVTLPSSQFVWCNNDLLTSPLLRSYYFSSEIQGAAIGSMVGAGIGAVGGFIAGLLVGVLIGCATIILCLLAFLVALIVAAVAVLVGAFAGGNIGRAIAGNSSPSGSPSGGLPIIQTVSNGDYVSINANLILYPDDNNAVVAWWVDNTTISGRSKRGEGVGGSSPFNFTDPRDNFNPDNCHLITDKEPAPKPDPIR
jgi:hypothetical protein